jgi:hypothetical protein
MAYVERTSIHRGAVGVLPFDEDQPDGRGSHRQPEYRVHLHTLRNNEVADIAARRTTTWVSLTLSGDTTGPTIQRLAKGRLRTAVTASATWQSNAHDCGK